MYLKKILPALSTQPAAPVLWYLRGGIPLANCKAAYAPKGAASYEASLINLASPGTNDAAQVNEGGDAITWNATNGWRLPNYTAADGRAFSTGLNLAGTAKAWSVIIRCNNFYATGGHILFGCCLDHNSPYTADNFMIYYGGEYSRFHSCGYLSDKDLRSMVTAAIAGNKSYKDGSPLTGTINGTGSVHASLTNFGIGCHWNGTAFVRVCRRLDVQAFAAYDTVLTDAQVAAISAAMAAL